MRTSQRKPRTSTWGSRVARLARIVAGLAPLGAVVLVLAEGACQRRPLTVQLPPEPPPLAPLCEKPAAGSAADTFAGGVRVAVIGDYGYAGQPEESVAKLVTHLRPDLVITTGDNNYPAGSASTIDQNIGQYYHAFIGDYRGSFGCRPAENRFFPSLGNHDWVTSGAEPYLSYFTLPGNERYYDFVRGNVHFFALDSDPSEPDGITATSAQAQWLQARLADSPAPFRVVYMHHAPYSSGPHSSNTTMQWPFKAWGVDLVLAGHDHTYERITVDGLPYIVCGLGGASLYDFGEKVQGSEVAFRETFGAGVIDADASKLRFRFFTTGGQMVDELVLAARR